MKKTNPLRREKYARFSTEGDDFEEEDGCRGDTFISSGDAPLKLLLCSDEFALRSCAALPREVVRLRSECREPMESTGEGPGRPFGCWNTLKVPINAHALNTEFELILRPNI